MNKKARIAGLVTGLIFVAYYIVAATFPIDNSILIDTANTATTIVYRDTNGNFSASTITAVGMTVINGNVSVSSITSSAKPFNVRGSYTTTEIATLTGKNGDIVYNTTVGTICVGSGTAATNGAYVYVSTSATSAKVVCGL